MLYIVYTVYHKDFTLRALTLRFLINFRKLTAKNTTKLGNLA